MLAGQGICFDQRESWAIGELAPEQRGQVSVDLNCHDLIGSRQKLFRQCARPGANLDCQIPSGKLSRIGDQTDEILVDHEILAKAVPRCCTGICKQPLNLTLGLGHRPLYVSRLTFYVSCQ
jgi:hypothetical protein